MAIQADGIRAGVRVVGELLITVGLLLLLFAGYLLWGTNLRMASAQADLRDALVREWSTAPTVLTSAGLMAPAANPESSLQVLDPRPPAAETGDGVALIRFPTLDTPGAVVVEGVTPEALRRGPGHMPGTALPGEVGNVVLSGHRTTYGAPFGEIGELTAGDPIEIETQAAVYTYQVLGLQVVEPTFVEVTYPVPGQLEAKPTRRLLTLTTCHPRYSARQRLIVTAELAHSRPLPAVAPASAGG